LRLLDLTINVSASECFDCRRKDTANAELTSHLAERQHILGKYIIADSHSPIALEVTAKTDPGLLRTLNEDSIAVNGELGLFVLADGMGGYKSGDVASRMVTEVMVSELTATRVLHKNVDDLTALLRSAVNKASSEVFAENRLRSQRSGSHPNQTMGSTLVLLLFSGTQLFIAHAGDSRVYRLRAGQLTLMTRDHSLLQEQIDSGVLSADSATSSHNRHLVTRGLGIRADTEVTIQREVAQIGDIYLLCSDGLNDMVDDADIELLLNALGTNLALAAEQLIMVANDNGGDDNISVILAKVNLHPTISTTTGARRRSFLDWLFNR
jgi:PPM family protein phosphatase